MTLLDHYYRSRSKYWRVKRLLFPSPAEVKFIMLMGGKVFAIDWLRSKPGGFPCTLILSRGKLLRQAHMKREVRYGRYYVDFANPIHWVIEIDGTIWHQDVVAEFDREVYINELLRRRGYDMRILRIKAPRLWHDAAGVKAEVIKFLAS